MKRFLGIIIIIASWVLAAYVGIWLMLAGGIIQIINSLDPVSAVDIAVGAIKIIFCGSAALIAYVGTVIGMTIQY